MTKRLKVLLGILCLAIVGCVAVTIINPNQIYRLNLDQHNIVSFESQQTEHIIGYGIDINNAEALYKFLQAFFEVYYVDEKVKIYKANPKWGTAIEHNGIVPYDGIYRESIFFGPDVIIYNGDDLTLLHELSHFFYHHMKRSHRDELFARLTAGFHQLRKDYQNLAEENKNGD